MSASEGPTEGSRDDPRTGGVLALRLTTLFPVEDPALLRDGDGAFALLEADDVDDLRFICPGGATGDVFGFMDVRKKR